MTIHRVLHDSQKAGATGRGGRKRRRGQVRTLAAGVVAAEPEDALPSAPPSGLLEDPGAATPDPGADACGKGEEEGTAECCEPDGMQGRGDHRGFTTLIPLV